MLKGLVVLSAVSHELLYYFWQTKTYTTETCETEEKPPIRVQMNKWPHAVQTAEQTAEDKADVELAHVIKNNLLE